MAWVFCCKFAAYFRTAFIRTALEGRQDITGKHSFFFYQGFLSPTLTTHRTAGKGGDQLLFHSTTSARSRTFRYLFATLHVRWLSHTFNCTACIYQAATRWDLPPYRITIWLIDDVTLVLFVCLRDDLILAFLLQQFETGNRWTRILINYHPCITSEPAN